MEHHAEHPSKKHTKRKSTDTVDSFLSLFLNCAIAAGLALLLACLMIPLGGALCFATEDPTSPIPAVGLAIRFLSALFGGVVAVRRNRGKVLLSGGLCGLILFLFTALLGLILPLQSRPFSIGISRLLRFAILPISLLGAVIGAKRQKTVRHKRH